MVKIRSFIFQSVMLLLVIVADCKSQSVVVGSSSNKTIQKTLYASAVKDSFYIYVRLPKGYDAKSKERYPVVYLLDANFLYNMVVATTNKYAEVGLLPPLILVGIGYKNMELMDSLRDRDYTFPPGLPTDSMPQSGGGKAFSSFIENQLVPYIDKEYNTETNNRTIMGHSFGGYFVAYTLLQSLQQKQAVFHNYVAASPSLEYHKGYLTQEFSKIIDTKITDTMYFYTTYGGLEGIEENRLKNTENNEPDQFGVYSQQLQQIKPTQLIVKSDIYSNFYHMDTAVPSCIKGLQWIFNTIQK